MTAVIDQESNATDTQLATIAASGGMAQTAAEALVKPFVPLAEEAFALVVQAESIVVTDATQVSEMKQSRTARLRLREIRIEVEKVRKGLKEDSLRRGQGIDLAANYIKGKVEPVEARLEEQEKFAERAEAKRKAELKASREALLAPFGIDTTHYQLGDMKDAAFAELLDSTRLAHEARVAAAKKAEADRIAAEEARKAEDARIRADNDRLKAEKEAVERAAAAEREKARQEALAAQARADVERQRIEAQARAEREKAEAKAAAERAAHEAVLRKEREAREQLERDAAEQRRIAEEKAKAEALAARRAAAAPDKQKLLTLAQTVRLIAVPSVKTLEAKTVAENAAMWIDALAARIEQDASKL